MPDDLIKNLEKALKDRFPIGIPRNMIGEATGGLLNPKTQSNLDSKGQGIPERFVFKKRTVYPVGSTIKYIEKHLADKVKHPGLHHD